MKQIPVIQEIDMVTGHTFNLAQSHTIMRYLADSRGVPDHWYPADLRKRAVVDMYLDQHHSFLRVGSSLSLSTLLSPRMTGKPIDSAMLKYSKNFLKRSLVDLETRLSLHAYICGPEKTIADLAAACELD